MDKIEELLTRGVEKIYPSKEDLEKVLRSGKKLRLYQGFDPSGIKLHIGHIVGLRKLRQFQNLGHKVIFLIGDFTGMIGDPSGKSETRKPLTREEVLVNAESYKEQVSKLLDFEGNNPVEIKYNSEWLSKLTAVDFLKLTSYFSAQQIIERDMFKKRLKEGKDLFLSEFLYPLLQGYDSVAMDVDLEVGGNDQLFNMMTGRDLMHKMKRKNKFVMTTPLLTDKNGNKIGKTEGNVIALDTKPEDLFGMMMNLPDEVIIKCFEFITDLPPVEIDTFKIALKKGANPMIFKKKLAYTLVRMLNSDKEAKNAQLFFETTFQKKEIAADIPVIEIGPATTSLPAVLLIEMTKLTKSRSEIRRLMAEKAIEIDGNVLADPKEEIEIKDGMVIRVGKHRFIKIKTQYEHLSKT